MTAHPAHIMQPSSYGHSATRRVGVSSGDGAEMAVGPGAGKLFRRVFDPDAKRRQFPDMWAAWCCANFRNSTQLGAAFGVDERTARNWMRGVSAPGASSSPLRAARRCHLPAGASLRADMKGHVMRDGRRCDLENLIDRAPDLQALWRLESAVAGELDFDLRVRLAQRAERIKADRVMSRVTGLQSKREIASWREGMAAEGRAPVDGEMAALARRDQMVRG